MILAKQDHKMLPLRLTISPIYMGQLNMENLPGQEGAGQVQTEIRDLLNPVAVFRNVSTRYSIDKVQDRP
jgi:hypothetical protein